MNTYVFKRVVRLYKVSVVVPVYNSEKYLRKCVDSILAQTLKDIEIILVDDGSTDQSGAICDEYARKSNVKVVHQKNSGPAITRNNGINLATGEYIGFVDSDDYIAPEMYEDLYNIANLKNIDIVTCGYNIVQGEKIIPKSIPLEPECIFDEIEIKKILCKANEKHLLWFPVKSIYRAEIVHKNNILFPNLNNGEETIFILESMLNSKSMYYIDKPYYNYVQTPDSLTRVKYKENYTERLETLYKLKMETYKRHKFSGYEADAYKYTMEHTLPLLLTNEMAHKASVVEKIKVFKVMRNSEMLKHAFKNCSVNVIKSKLKYMALLLKWKLYLPLAILTSL